MYSGLEHFKQNPNERGKKEAKLTLSFGHFLGAGFEMSFGFRDISVEFDAGLLLGGEGGGGGGAAPR